MSKRKIKIQQPKFGTFLGVYTPSILTILGLIMYLRFGWVVGNLGLTKTIMVVLMASSITFITGLSASAIATNIKIGVGGEYYMISRSLGLEFGGAIGFPLYLCRTLSVTFYCYGLSEAILALWPNIISFVPFNQLVWLTIFFILVVTFVSGKSAKIVLRSQLPIMIIVGLSIVALIVGVMTNELQSPPMVANYATAPEGFWYVFAVFFPAVTGFTAGIGLSGDLKNPQKSIPRGTIGAVLTGALIYILIPVLLSVSALLTLEELSDPEAGVTIWTRIAFLGPFIVYPAVWGAVLSSAIGSILGGPRILQALSMDGLAPKFLSKLSKTGQPTIATWISGGIALAAVFLGGLNTIAQYVSVLFLTLYVAVNLSAATEKIIKEPSYRPKINVPWYVSGIGALAAMLVMWLINPWALVFAIGLEIVIFSVLIGRKFEQQWGDAATGVWMHLARYSLLKLNEKKVHARNWRPIIILFIKDPLKNMPLVKFAEMLGQNSGLLTISRLITLDDATALKNRHEISNQMLDALSKEGLQALTEINLVENLKDGMFQVAASHGIAGIKTNTAIFGWSTTQTGQIEELKVINNLARSGKNILMANFKQSFLIHKNKRIDIWWRGQDKNGDLMLLLSYLVRLNNDWKKTKVNILTVANNTSDRNRLNDSVYRSIKDARIDAKVEVKVLRDEHTLSYLFQKSKDADLVFLGLERHSQDLNNQATQINSIIKELKAVVFVQNNSMKSEIPRIFEFED